MASQYDGGIQIQLLTDEKSINFGAVYENAVAQEFHAHGFDLHYFNSKKQGELDFVIEKNGEIMPIEVKSGKDYQRHNALTNVMANVEYQIRKAIVFSNTNVRQSGKILYLPIYMTAFLVREIPDNIVYTVDLSGL